MASCLIGTCPSWSRLDTPAEVGRGLTSAMPETVGNSGCVRIDSALQAGGCHSLGAPIDGRSRPQAKPPAVLRFRHAGLVGRRAQLHLGGDSRNGRRCRGGEQPITATARISELSRSCTERCWKQPWTLGASLRRDNNLSSLPPALSSEEQLGRHTHQPGTPSVPAILLAAVS